MILLFADIETTGTNVFTDEILEVGYIRVNVMPKANSTQVSMDIITSGSLFFFKDGWNSEANTGAYEKHQLSNAYMKQFTDQEIFDRNISTLYSLVYNSYFAGKNSDRFDLPMIKNFIERHTYHLNELCLAGNTIDVEKVLAGPFKEWYRNKTGQDTRRRGTLEEYMQMMNISDDEILSIYKTLNVPEGREHAHAGLYDSLMTFLAFKYAVEKLNMTFKL